MWMEAQADGFVCGQQGGYQEQNPYELYEPLFDAWRSGWFQGIYSSTNRHLWAPGSSKTLRILEHKWLEKLAKARLHYLKDKTHE